MIVPDADQRTACYLRRFSEEFQIGLSGERTPPPRVATPVEAKFALRVAHITPWGPCPGSGCRWGPGCPWSASALLFPSGRLPPPGATACPARCHAPPCTCRPWKANAWPKVSDIKRTNVDKAGRTASGGVSECGPKMGALLAGRVAFGQRQLTYAQGPTPDSRMPKLDTVEKSTRCEPPVSRATAQNVGCGVGAGNWTLADRPSTSLTVWNHSFGSWLGSVGILGWSAGGITNNRHAPPYFLLHCGSFHFIGCWGF